MGRSFAAFPEVLRRCKLACVKATTRHKWAERVRAWRTSGQEASEFAAGKGFEASTGYNHPFLRAFLKKPMPVIGNEPKLQLLQDFQDDVHFIGYPGPMTKTATSMYAKFIVPTMFAEVAKGKNPRQAMDEAEQKLRAVQG